MMTGDFFVRQSSITNCSWLANKKSPNDK